MSAECICGHPEEAHTEIAIFPPCEGTHWPPGRPFPESKEWRKPNREAEICGCEGYEPDGD